MHGSGVLVCGIRQVLEPCGTSGRGTARKSKPSKVISRFQNRCMWAGEPFLPICSLRCYINLWASPPATNLHCCTVLYRSGPHVILPLPSHSFVSPGPITHASSPVPYSSGAYSPTDFSPTRWSWIGIYWDLWLRTVSKVSPLDTGQFLSEKSQSENLWALLHIFIALCLQWAWHCHTHKPQKYVNFSFWR